MSAKLIAIGNTIMKDDGIGPWVAAALDKYLWSLNIQPIIAETDIDYCIDCIDENDIVFIIDAVISNKVPGTVSVFNVDKLSNQIRYSHELNFISYIKKIKTCSSVFVIGIEPFDISFGDTLSSQLTKKFNQILLDVMLTIESIIH